MSIKYLTAGESHGKMLLGILEGVPAGLTVDAAEINHELARRQAGYGRGARMQIEHDEVELIAGVRNCVTLGSPVGLLIPNTDHANWVGVMDCGECDVTARVVEEARPGHADYVGCKKFGHTDARNVLERASARNTASIVALGAIAKQFLAALGVEVVSYVTCIGAAEDTLPYGSIERIKRYADASAVRAINARAEQDMIQVIDRAKSELDTVGGAFRVVVGGMRQGIGSCMTFDGKLDGRLMNALGGMQGVKGISFGAGQQYASAFGTKIHDAMFATDEGVERRTNNAGGVEGGMSNGEELVINAVFKAIPTTMRGLPTVSVATGRATVSSKERSDICAVPAAAVVAEALTALTLMQAILDETGGSTMKEVTQRWKA